MGKFNRLDIENLDQSLNNYRELTKNHRRIQNIKKCFCYFGIIILILAMIAGTTALLFYLFWEFTPDRYYGDYKDLHAGEKDFTIYKINDRKVTSENDRFLRYKKDIYWMIPSGKCQAKEESSYHRLRSGDRCRKIQFSSIGAEKWDYCLLNYEDYHTGLHTYEIKIIRSDLLQVSTTQKFERFTCGQSLNFVYYNGTDLMNLQYFCDDKKGKNYWSVSNPNPELMPNFFAGFITSLDLYD